MVDWTTLGGFLGVVAMFIAFAALIHHWFQTATKGLEGKLDTHMELVQGQFKTMDARFNQVDARLDRVDARFDQVDARLDRVDARFDQVDARFDRLEDALAIETAERRSDTRKLEGRIDELDKRIFYLATQQRQPPRRKSPVAA